MRKALVGVPILAVVWAVACTSNSAGGGSPCSNGPTYSWDSTFTHTGQPPSSLDFAKCTPHCGAEPAAADGTYPPEALPSGPCTEEEACSMTISIYCCNDRRRPGARHGMRCECDGNTWTCQYSSQGAGGCGGSCSDAGAEAGSDSGRDGG